MTSLNKNFTTIGLIKFSISSMLMMVFLASYTAVDGMFISNFGEDNAMAALNIVMPVISAILALSFMFSTGINSIISKYMGEGKQDKANSMLTTIYIIATIVGIIISLICFIFQDQILHLIGANDLLLPIAKRYFSVIIFFIPFLFLQDFGQVFFITASRPSFAFLFTVIGGVINAILDYVFLVKMNMGISGAALATGIGYLFPSLASIIYFLIRRENNICFGKPEFDWKNLFCGFYNGSSEFIANISQAVTVVFTNFIILSLAGEVGVNAMGVIVQIQFLLVSLFIGYSIGVLPIISYKYGEQNKEQLLSVIKKSVKIVISVSAIMVFGALIFKNQIIGSYLDSSSEEFLIATNGFSIYAWGFLAMGFNFFASMMFTGISDAKSSITIAILRTFVFLGMFMFILPKMFGLTGVFLAVPFAETLTLLVSLFLMKKKLANIKFGGKVHG